MLSSLWLLSAQGLAELHTAFLYTHSQSRLIFWHDFSVGYILLPQASCPFTPGCYDRSPCLCFVISAFKKKFLESSWFTMLCQFQVYSKVDQLYTYIYPLFFRFFSHKGHFRVLSRIPCATQQVLVGYLFYVQLCVYLNPQLLIYPCPLLLSGNSAYKESACNAGDPDSIPGSRRFPGEGIGYPLQYPWTSFVAHLVKNPPAMWETWVKSLGWEDPLEKGEATHPSILAWKIPWTA